jgi:hypothetical protein
VSIHTSHSTASFDYPHDGSALNSYDTELPIPLEYDINWQDLQLPTSFDSSFSTYDSYDNTLLSFAPISNEDLSLSTVPAFDANNTFFDNPAPYSPDPVPDSASAVSMSKSSPESASLQPESSSSSLSRVEKRKANTLAARRYRQKRVDRVAELEAALEATQRERDALKVRVAKLEGESEVLKGLVRSGLS